MESNTPNKTTKIGTNSRRIFLGGLTNKNFALPPPDSGLFAFLFGKDDNSEIKTKHDTIPEEVHLYKPNSIVIADVEWLIANIHKVEEWYNQKNYTEFNECELLF